MNDQEVRIAQLEQTLREFVAAVAKGESTKLHAIRAYRMATGASIKDAKDYVESFEKPKSLDDARMQRMEDRLVYLERRVSVLENPTHPGVAVAS